MLTSKLLACARIAANRRCCVPYLRAQVLLLPPLLPRPH
jgi:hypothetical protein